YYVVFFFSSRRRHTRCYRDWSSDVCSSDLKRVALGCARTGRHALQVSIGEHPLRQRRERDAADPLLLEYIEQLRLDPSIEHRVRSEERRVGKECKSRWSESQ